MGTGSAEGVSNGADAGSKMVAGWRENQTGNRLLVRRDVVVITGLIPTVSLGLKDVYLRWQTAPALRSLQVVLLSRWQHRCQGRQWMSSDN